MAIQSQPSRIPEPFAGSGTKNVIPATNAAPSASQAASWASGFPPECSQPISAGGCPVPRNDVNGALNQLSQDFAFRQDGGVWEWSALADYDTQRMVRGSDGTLYWSVAQSGPGVAAGAQDPTADDGTHWASPSVKTMDAGDSSNAAASTAWVAAWYAAQRADSDYYVDPASGDDSNTGTNPAAPLQTVGRAVTIIYNNPVKLPVAVTIHLAAGTYSESLTHTILGSSIIFSGPASGYATLAGAYFGYANTTTTLLGRIQLGGQLQVSRAATLVLGDGAYLCFDNLGSANTSIYVAQNGVFAMNAGTTATLAYTGTNAFSTGTVEAVNGGRVSLASLTTAGTVTGRRYYLRACASINGAGSATLFPGNADGQVDTTSYYG